MLKFLALNDMVIIKEIKEEKITPSWIILPKSAIHDSVERGIVEKYWPDVRGLEKWMEVFFRRYGKAREYEIENNKYIYIKAADVLAEVTN
jgi:co-chaperonin GroES (HSP10)